MSDLQRCRACRGFVPAALALCPNCDRGDGIGGWVERGGKWLKAAGGGAIAMTLMACYGAPMGPDGGDPRAPKGKQPAGDAAKDPAKDPAKKPVDAKAPPADKAADGGKAPPAEPPGADAKSPPK